MKPIIKPLARWHRKIIFFLLLLAFIFSLPAFMFYATGYRYDFFSSTPSITATGGLYISAEALDSKIFIDEEEVTNARLFRRASYIQGLEPGLRRVHVQAPGLHTWVKNLTVYPYIVTEVESFNLPLVPQVRPVTQYQTIRGEAVVFVNSTSTEVLAFATTSISFVSTTSKATSTYAIDSEYPLLKDLFAEKASTTTSLKRVESTFGFSTTTVTSTTTEAEQATTTVSRNNLTLYKSEEDVFAAVIDQNKKIPPYFCTNRTEYVANKSVEKSLIPSTGVIDENLMTEDQSAEKLECRKEILIDRKYQTVKDFTFFPGSESLVLMLLENGLYVVEVDDRSWQNVQMLYPGRDLHFIVYGGGIFVKDGYLILEALTEIIVK